MKGLSLIFFALLVVMSTFAQNQTITDLAQNFNNPPPSAKARTWWHWLNGNVTKTGITADLEAMAAVGIQEAQLFNVKLSNPQGPIDYLSEEWLELFHFAASEAQRVGMELAFHNGPGWSSSGGPWITPEYAMQTVVYSETVFKGGARFKAQLPKPETRLDYYKDIAVLAFPKPQSGERIDGLDYKNLSGRVRNHLLPDEKEIPATAVIQKSDIIDLTAKVSTDGFLEWDAPAGEWLILRLGHTPTGRMNQPAPPSGRGLECDKMSRKAVDVFWQGGITPILKKLGPLAGSVVTNCIIDSYEVDATNWTSGFDKAFKKLRAYDCLLYLPTLAGYYVESGEVSERFLWDFRRTIGDLIAENYYSYFGELCHQHGMQFSVEPYWGPFDNMQVGATGDIVMCEFWSGGFPFFDSPKFVSSIAHLNGSSIVGAEAFTGIGGWDEHPATIKSIGDRAWAQGITRFVFHTYVHQPWNVAPGLALSYHGTDFNRLNTWWIQGKAFMDYVGRSQFLLQQGKSVADVLVFTGESSPNNALLIPEIKAMGFDYDLVGVNKLEDLTVNDGQICTPVGGRYRVLVLPKIDWIRPETLQKLEELAEAGAIIIGTKPKKSPSLNGYPECDKQVAQLAEKLWGTALINDKSIVDFLIEGEVPPDFSVEQGNKTDISFIHKKQEDTDTYFIANSRLESREELFRFRISGKQPELWNAETGDIKDLAEWQDNGDGTTSIPIRLASEEAVFVIFRKPFTSSEHLVKTSMSLTKPKSQPLSNLKIIKAEYGTFLQEGLVDITAKVASEVKDGKLNIIATRDFCDCDPAMGYKKEFRMEYEIGNTVQQIYVMEKEAVNIDASEKGELKILKAVFGKFKPETRGVPKYYPSYDITDEIKAKVSTGIFEIQVNKSLIDGQVAEGNKKALRITYSTDGIERIVSIPEGGKLILSKDIPEPELVFNKGKVDWITPYPGKLTFSTSSGKTKTLQVKSVPDPIVINKPWVVQFPKNLKAPEKATFNKLIYWSLSEDEGIRYFSGTASYHNEFVLPEKLVQNGISLELDLGSVCVIAEVFVNRENLGVLWKSPFRVNLDGFVQAGINNLEIKVTNLWPNRLIGDENIPADFIREGSVIKQWPAWLENPAERPSERITFAGYKHWDKDSELQTSGLLGPVKIIVSEIKVLN
jgi:hypothetical protein